MFLQASNFKLPEELLTVIMFTIMVCGMIWIDKKFFSLKENVKPKETIQNKPFILDENKPVITNKSNNTAIFFAVLLIILTFFPWFDYKVFSTSHFMGDTQNYQYDFSNQFNAINMPNFQWMLVLLVFGIYLNSKNNKWSILIALLCIANISNSFWGAELFSDNAQFSFGNSFIGAESGYNLHANKVGMSALIVSALYLLSILFD